MSNNLFGLNMAIGMDPNELPALNIDPPPKRDADPWRLIGTPISLGMVFFCLVAPTKDGTNWLGLWINLAVVAFQFCCFWFSRSNRALYRRRYTNVVGFRRTVTTPPLVVDADGTIRLHYLVHYNFDQMERIRALRKK